MNDRNFTYIHYSTMISFMLEYQRFLHALDHRIQVVWYAAHLLPVAFAFEWMIVTYPAATGRFR